MTVKTPKNEKCPVCKVEISWIPLESPNTFRGNCPKCGMGFTFMNGAIVSDPKFSKK